MCKTLIHDPAFAHLLDVLSLSLPLLPKVLSCWRWSRLLPSHDGGPVCMAIAELQQGVMVHIGCSDCWDMVGMWGRLTVLLTSHWVVAIVLVPVGHEQTQSRLRCLCLHCMFT